MTQVQNAARKGNFAFLTDKEYEKIKEKDRLGKGEKRTNKI